MFCRQIAIIGRVYLSSTLDWSEKTNRKCKSHIGIELNAEWSVQMSESQSEEEGLEVRS